EHRNDKVVPTAEKVFQAMQRLTDRMRAVAEAPLDPAGWLKIASKAIQRRADPENGPGRCRKGHQDFPGVEFRTAAHRLSAESRSGRTRPGYPSARRNGAGGYPRPAGWGLPPLFDGADLVDPHFEKMLYDNAQLLRLYAEAYETTGGQ